MGLDAFVRCNCWQEGKTTTPPVDRALICADDEGYMEIAEDADLSPSKRRRLSRLLYDWQKICCPHPNMDYCSERVGNWGAVRALQQEIDPARYPALAAIFPQGNGGMVETETVPQVLQELGSFKEEIPQREGVFLINAETGESIYSFLAAYEGEFAWGDGLAAGVDPGGLFVREQQSGRELFRSVHFTQMPLPPEQKKHPSGKEYTQRPALLRDCETGAELRFWTIIGGAEELAVIRRALRPEDFYALPPLERLLQASLETGNPICWI